MLTSHAVRISLNPNTRFSQRRSTMQAVTATGNATLIAYDDGPLLATDPWMGDEDPAYFGSWMLAQKIPAHLKHDIGNAKYLWFSHGHPDHLNPISLNRYRGKKILLPDHVGGRIRDGLRDEGFEVEVLPDRRWVDLSANVRIQCITTVIQDAILLVDVCGVLFVNLNDAGTRGCRNYLRHVVKQYKKSFVMALTGYGDGDMMNIWDEDGNFVPPPVEVRKNVGLQLESYVRSIGATTVMPFSSFHQYHRKDSIWAQKYTTPMTAYKVGLSPEVEYVEPFSTVNCRNLETYHSGYEPLIIAPEDPETFGDNWSDVLEKADVEKIRDYFMRKDHVRNQFGFLNFRVGGVDNFISLRGAKDKGITFEAPRTSLMTSIEYRIFDDLLLGNFMKTTFHNIASLYEGKHSFNFIVTKYADNGLVEQEAAIETYLAEYRRRAAGDYIYETFLDHSKRLFNRFISYDTGLFQLARTMYLKHLR